VITVIEDTEEGDLHAQAHSPWLVLIADDDHSVHEATVAALAGQLVHNRSLSFLHAYSAAETVSLLAASKGVHLVLLDVVMESPDAGLRAVAEIREKLGLHDLKIVIRTGQPGHAPEQEIPPRIRHRRLRQESRTDPQPAARRDLFRIAAGRQ
jgi:CheY-like chemotaxis protein